MELEGSLHLTVVAGLEDRAFHFLPSDSPVQIGRLSSAGCRLDDPTVSRRHAVLSYDDGAWFIDDSGSRGGTAINGSIIAGRARLWDGDEIGVGPWRLQVMSGLQSESTLTLTDDAFEPSSLRTRDRRISQPLAARRLGLLLEYANRLHSAEEESSLGAELLDAACRGAHFSRGAIVRGGSGGRVAEIVAQEGDPGSVSRSVLREAESGRVVRLRDTPELMQAQSIIIDSVRDVLCVPITPEKGGAMYLYLVRDQAGDEDSDEVDFCVALVRLAEIALTGLHQRGIEREIRAAREAQERIMPDSEGEAPGLCYAMHSRPGRGVAGDLFDVVRIDERYSAVLLGDITGKGAGPGLLMTAAQAFLNGEFRRSEDLLPTVEALNRYIVQRSMMGEFLTLWIGVYDAETRSVRYIDAGHGFAALAVQDGAAELLQEGGGPPLGISDVHTWGVAERILSPGDQIVLFSDGLVEQRDARGEMHGVDPILANLNRYTPPRERVDALCEAVLRHAGHVELGDDLTLACIEARG